MFGTLQAGQSYLNTLPNQPKLAQLLPDYRVIRLIKLSAKIMPAFACFAMLWQYFFSDPEQSALATASLTAILAITIPFQGLFLLGKRAKSPLPDVFLPWYQELRRKLILEQIELPEQTVPRFQDLARLLALAEKCWGQRYFDEL